MQHQQDGAGLPPGAAYSVGTKKHHTVLFTTPSTSAADAEPPNGIGL